MRSRKVFFTSCVAIVLGMALFIQDGVAEDPLAPKESELKASKMAPKKVKPGIISTTGDYRGAANIDQESTGKAGGDDFSVITGSISSSGRNKCTAKVTNNSKHFKYAVSYKVIGKNARGAKVLNRSFSSVIKPDETISRDIKGCKRELNLSLKVLSGRRLGDVSKKSK